MFSRVQKVKSAAEWVRQALPQYEPLIKEDLRECREELIKVGVGLSIAAAAGLMFSLLLSAAIVISAWDGPRRIFTAWIITGVWALLALIGIAYARRAASGPLPFRRTGAALTRDHAAVLALIDPEGDRDSH